VAGGKGREKNEARRPSRVTPKARAGSKSSLDSDFEKPVFPYTPPPSPPLPPQTTATPAHDFSQPRASREPLFVHAIFATVTAGGSEPGKNPLCSPSLFLPFSFPFPSLSLPFTPSFPSIRRVGARMRAPEKERASCNCKIN
jgi:hypothetical protein